MSSTNRGATREASDYYVTPQWAIADFLREFTADSPEIIGYDISKHENLTVLDPCAGGDADRPMAYPEAIKHFTGWNVGKLHTLDIRRDSRAEIKADFLTLQQLFGLGPEVIITNPPFGLAIPIIKKALDYVHPGGVVIMLQRLNFFGAKSRLQFWKNNMPVATYVHSKRMAFMPSGAINPKSGKPYTQDSIEYAHFVWQKNAKPNWTKLRII